MESPSPTRIANSAPQACGKIALYVHWPFCLSKCPYCDFNSHVREGVEHERWKKALLAELEYFTARTGYTTLTSIFFGGGTPSLMEAATVGALIEKAKGLWKPAPDIEITLEANPTSVEAGKFLAFREAGVNRVSLGVQSLRAEPLAFLGRKHSAEEALKAVRLAAETFPRFSFDLIYALPGQTPEAWEEELKQALHHANGHMSLYQLTIEEGTNFHHLYHAGKFALPEEKHAARMYERTQEVMEAAGLPAYEVSNHARPGEESRHNLTYWRGGEYIGIGPGAHGRIGGWGIRDGGLGSSKRQAGRFNPEPAPCEQQQAANGGGPLKGTQRLATATLKSPEKWLAQVEAQGHGLEVETALTAREAFEERVMMGLRITEGLPLAALGEAVNTPVVRKLVEEGLLSITGDRIAATAKGMLCLTALTGAVLTA